MNAVDRAIMQMMCAKKVAKSQIEEKFIIDERGVLPIIQIIQMISIIFIIVLIFRDEIFNFVQNLWEIVIAPILFSKL